MPIEYLCPTCQVRMRTPDDAAGKSARCPQCGNVSIVPGTPAAYAAGMPAQRPPVAHPAAPPPAANPFADRPETAASLNPYAPPTYPGSHAWPMPLTKEQVRGKLLGPAIGMIVFAIGGLGFMVMAGIGFAIDQEQVFRNVGDDPAEQAGAIGFFIAYFTVGLISRVVQLLGAIAMLRVRGYSLAMAGAICAVIPCEVYCCLPCLPFGIWGLIVLYNSQVKAAFA